MSKSCPHCGFAIDESESICRECDVLFHSMKAPARRGMPSASQPLPDYVLTDEELQARPHSHKAPPLNGFQLIGIAVVIFVVGWLVGLAQRSAAVEISLALLGASLILFVIGIVRLISGIGINK